MNIFAFTCFILLSSDAGFVFGSNIRGGLLGTERGDQHVMGNLALRSEAVASEETADDTAITLFKEAEFEEYNLLAHSFTQLSGEINDALLEGNNDMSGGESAHTRQAFISFLKEGNGVPGIPVETGLPSKESKEEQERDGQIIVGNDSLQEAMGESISDVSMQLIRGNGNTSYQSYRKESNKGCRNHNGKKGSNHHDYDLIVGCSKGECEVKCNGLGDHCYGFEYSSYDQRCEVWRVSIKYIQYVDGLDCYIKNKKSTPHPTKKPTPSPTKKPTPYPTKKPTPYPTKKPTPYPTKKPTPYPTKKPTPYPTKRPTPYPTKRPTLYPTKRPTPYPTKKPTPYPTKKPTLYPTKKPTPYPTKKPTLYPTKKPTPYPTKHPGLHPKKKPTDDQSGKYLHAKSLDFYPGYTGSIDISGHITVTFPQKDQMHFAYELQGLEPWCTDCGVHIHSGTTCDDADEVGGHYFSIDVDPWTADDGATYNADEYGTAKGSFSLSSGLDTLKDNKRHAVVVHGQDGTRLSCGILKVKGWM